MSVWPFIGCAVISAMGLFNAFSFTRKQWVCMSVLLTVVSALIVLTYQRLSAEKSLATYYYWQNHPKKKAALLHALSSSNRCLCEKQLKHHPQDQRAQRLLLTTYLRAHISACLCAQSSACVAAAAIS